MNRDWTEDEDEELPQRREMERAPLPVGKSKSMRSGKNRANGIRKVKIKRDGIRNRRIKRWD